MRIPAIKGFDQQALEKYFKNTGMSFIGKVGSMVIKMGITVLVARYLSKDRLGIITGGVTYVYLFSALATLGLDQFVVKELHQFPENRDKGCHIGFVRWHCERGDARFP
jgi:O-antigen/teichoic acid export membrane protein